MRPGRRVFLRVAGSAAVASAAAVALGCAASGIRRRRLGMAIDVRKCVAADGCRSCIDACHRAHNVPAIPDVRHEVKWIWKEPFERALAVEDADTITAALRGRSVTVFCNHCDNPPCVRVCPTQATWARDDGVVTVDAHRCIGCRYCVAACPYGSRSFNWVDPQPFVPSPLSPYPARTRGVVEKCNLCEERLAVGQLPACVEACPEHAMVFGDLRDPASDIRRLLAERYAIRRRPELGTRPQVYYVI
ncbi:MAG: 4Fe-4S dicluster domain-containing protein [Acidobacteria bacterium]|nr:4Fe-4S dicluster domain-containing protein [Acidobacteriota bacterium]